jgi:type I restriction enzyme S subunit
MEALLKKGIEGLKLDRSDWQLVKFGDVAIQQKKTVNRESTDLTRYVKGEHMYSEDMHLREWGELTDEYLGPAFTRKFEEGDVLYGSRRTYLRKVVVAPFEGITSNTTFVVKANEKRIDKRLLPFIMLSEGFSQHSIRNSKGSVNPYVNWKDLSGYEFLLPPIKEQQGFVELLLLCDEMNEASARLSSSVKNILDSSIHNYTLGIKRLREYSGKFDYQDTKLGAIPSDWDLAPLHKYSELITNGFVGKATPYYTNEAAGVKYIQGMNVRRNKMDLKGLTYVSHEFNIKQSKTQLQEGDILTVQSGHIGETAVLPKYLEGSNCHAVIITRLYKSEFNPKFVSYFINSPKGQVKIKGITVGTTVAHVNTSELNKYLVPKPIIEEQNEIVAVLDSLTEVLDNSHAKNIQNKGLLKGLINEVF